MCLQTPAASSPLHLTIWGASGLRWTPALALFFGDRGGTCRAQVIESGSPYRVWQSEMKAAFRPHLEACPLSLQGLSSPSGGLVFPTPTLCLSHRAQLQTGRAGGGAGSEQRKPGRTPGRPVQVVQTLGESGGKGNMGLAHQTTSDLRPGLLAAS